MRPAKLREASSMNAPTSPAAADKSRPLESAAGPAVEEEISKLIKAEINNDSAKQESPKLPAQTENNADRIRSSVARLTSNSVDELGRLTSELQEMQEFLRSEVARVQAEIESALAGIKIIIETIAPWKSIADSLAPPSNARSGRGGPASGLPPYGKAPS
jgi:hypothetical protein